MKVEKFLGLTKKQAQDLSEKLNLIFRLIKSDNKDFFSYPEDKREDRICVELVDGLVSKASIQ
jgi:hypothetical protein